MGHKGSKTSSEGPALQTNSRDIRLLVPDENNKIHTIVVPKSLLLAHSEVFNEMVSTSKYKKAKKLKLEGVHVIGVLRLMQYVENGIVTFEKVSEVSETLKVAEKYGIPGIEDVCKEYMSNTLDSDNVCEIYDLCTVNNFTDIIYKCLQVIDRDTERVLNSEGFLNLKLSVAQDIIKRKSLTIVKETTIYNAILKWAEAEFERRNGKMLLDNDNIKKIMKPLMTHIQFQNMSEEELDSLKQNELNISDYLNTENSQAIQRRCYTTSYIHYFDIFESPQSPVANGENFYLSIEILKGKIYFCGVSLALKQVSTRMNASSALHAMLCGTNKRNSEQKKVRSTFLNIDDELPLTFSSPLYLQDNDILEIHINVKMAGNVRPFSRKNDTEIIVPDFKDIALKVLPANDTTQSIIRSILKNFIYFF